MKLSLEIPTAYLPDWSPLCDLDFVLAHRVLEDDHYAKYFLSRAKGRELILDNSMHELGTALTPGELLEAARRCRADFVVAPDRLKDPDFCLAQYRAMQKVFKKEFRVAVAMSGRTESERALYLDAVRDADLICMPYRENRLDWIQEQYQRLRRWHRLHLFGMSTIQELQRWKDISAWSLSMDTAKPIKWGIAKDRFTLVKDLRGAPTSSLDLLSVRNLSCAQTECVLWNIAYLRTLL